MTGRVHGNGDERSELIASEIRAWLARRKLTQGDLARHLGIARSAVSVRMSGARDFTLVELMEIAEWLDVTLADLLGPDILQVRRSPHTDLVGAGASRISRAPTELLRLDSNQQPFD
ncbi:helix-turn-helix transcriptional regulator [Micrococcus lacusdianchii]|uniref:helix-turn-helix transcriptional regulator n=1 Tax=Micrococcus lacusdianchii TaxID=2915940 RepID=UPI003AB1070C